MSQPTGIDTIHVERQLLGKRNMWSAYVCGVAWFYSYSEDRLTAVGRLVESILRHPHRFTLANSVGIETHGGR